MITSSRQSPEAGEAVKVGLLQPQAGPLRPPRRGDGPGMSAWQPMSTAPMDGTRVLLLYPRALPGSDAPTTATVGSYRAEAFLQRPRPYWHCDREQVWGRSYLRAHPPVAWMPIPALDLETQP